MTPTEQLIHDLASLKSGDLGRLRQHVGHPLDESVDGFDLFAGLWWPLRQKSERVPRREVAWLVAKLYAAKPIPQTVDATLASQFGRITSTDDRTKNSYQRMFDDLLVLPLNQIEYPLHLILALIAANSNQLDWVRLTNELSIWEREDTRIKWAREYCANHRDTATKRSLLC